MFGFTEWLSVYLVAGERLALIDTGPATSAEVVRTGIENLGFSLKDISYVFITHIHLDHWGGVGILMEQMPQAKIFVHPQAVKHLIDPSFLMNNLKKQLGMKVVQGLGELLPIPASRVQALSDNEVIDLGNGEKLRIVFAPGHASSGLCILEEKGEGLFAGDAAGLYFSKEDVLLIPTPPGFNVKQALSTLQRLLDLSPSRLFFGHFGITVLTKEVLERALTKTQLCWDVVSKAIREGGKPSEIACRVAEEFSPDLEKLQLLKGEKIYKYVIEDLIPIWVDGSIACYKKITASQS